MDDSFPQRRARTGAFRRGQPRSAAVFGPRDAWRVRYLASAGPTDPVLSLRSIDHLGGGAVLADPRLLVPDDEQMPAAERARRERLREGGAGITAFSSDDAGHRSVFSLSGQLWLVDDHTAPRRLPASGSVIDPRISPDGTAVAYHADGGLRLLALDGGAGPGAAPGPGPGPTSCPDSGAAGSVAAPGTAARPAPDLDRMLCAPHSPTWTWGLAEFIAAEEMGRHRGFWWSPDSQQLVVAAVDEAAVEAWWISDPADPAVTPRAIRYPAAGTPNATVSLWLVGRDGRRQPLPWDAEQFPYLAGVHIDRFGAACSVQSRDQQRLRHLRIDLQHATTEPVGEQVRQPWVDLVAGSPRFAPDGDLVLVDVDPDTDSWRLRKGGRWLTAADWYVRSLLRCDRDGSWVSACRDPRESHLVHVGYDGAVAQLTTDGGWHSVLAAGPVPIVAVADRRNWQPTFTVGDPRAPLAHLPDRAESPQGRPRVQFLPTEGAVRVAVVLPPEQESAPVIVSSYGGPHAQRAVSSPLAFATEQWLADQGYAVVVIDGRGSPGVAPSCEASIAGDLAGPPLADQVTGLAMAAAAFPGRLDTTRVGIRGWSFGGYLAALAVLREPEVFHAAFAGAPVTEWRLYDTHYTERYLGLPEVHGRTYDASSLLPLAGGLRRPLCLVHGMADDNVVAAHTLRLSAALTAAGRPHEVLPLPGISHMTPQESITENLLRMELAFFRRHLPVRTTGRQG